MRFMVIVDPLFQVPEERLPAMIDGLADWWARYRDKWESAGFFASSNGGGGIVQAADAAELQQMLLEMPFSPYSKFDIHPLVDVDTAVGQWQAALAAMGESSTGD